jgi:hypothetical protein
MALRFCGQTQSVVSSGNAIWAYEWGHVFLKMNKNVLITNIIDLTFPWLSLKHAQRNNVSILYRR